MTDEEREAARDELLAKIATLMAKRALEAAKKQLENIIEQQPDSEAAQTASGC